MYHKILEQYPNADLSAFTVLDNGKTGYGQRFDDNWENRQRLAQILFPLIAPNHKPLLRFLIEQEIICCRDYDGGSSLLKALCFMLYTMAEIEDSHLFYLAKFNTNFDVRIEADIEPIFGKNKDETKRYFAQSEPELVKAIEEYETRPYRSHKEYIRWVEENNMMEYWLNEP
ncbi:hypothetical protein [Budvicia aquatica]|uniref:DUF4375 domain-containing protein n=1 Tax=Budvicia aquatica TaxID=82979 RepID=A0A2C6DRL5_9GAMM|nr:hypothetical protein [Budvicia aquatica]PHI31464.1 hypothetical protein CRN84_20040 [Budvicia aquatica]